MATKKSTHEAEAALAIARKNRAKLSKQKTDSRDLIREDRDSDHGRADRVTESMNEVCDAIGEVKLDPAQSAATKKALLKVEWSEGENIDAVLGDDEGGQISASGPSAPVDDEVSLVMHGIPWDLYVQLRDATEGQGLRMTYLDGALEIQFTPYERAVTQRQDEARRKFIEEMGGEPATQEELDAIREEWK
jgi:hypothetical protein